MLGVVHEKVCIPLLCQDEARIGQENKITRRWAKRGKRPSAPKDQRTCSAYIFGAICPARGVGAGLVLPRCNTDAMNLHLTEFSVAVATDAHAVLMVDQAGWHLAKDLKTPDNITMMLLPPTMPSPARVVERARTMNCALPTPQGRLQQIRRR